MEDQTVTLLAIFFCTLLQLFLFLYPHLTVLTTDLLFAYKVSHGFESNAGVRAMGAGKLADGMAFAVGKKAEDALTHGGAGVVGHAVGGSMSQTHVADAAIGGAGLTKIAQELTAAAAYSVAPDFAIVVEGTTAADISGVPDEKKVCRLGGGAVVSFMDRGTVYDSELYKKAFEIAEKNGIGCQTKTVVAGGNNASAIHKAAGGIKTLAVSVPCRYIHSGSSVAKKEDIDSTFELVKALFAELSQC